MDWLQLAQGLKRLVFPPLRNLPPPVYTTLFVRWKEPHEILERLRCIRQNGEIEGKRVTLIRIVDPAELRQRGLRVYEYADLHGHTEVIWYEGWFMNAPGFRVELTPVNPGRNRL